MTGTVRTGVALIGMLLALQTPSNAGTVVSGVVLTYSNGKDSPRPGIRITACRQGPAAQTVSDSPDGTYKLDVPSGSPFYVVFEDPEGIHLPALQYLSGRPSSNHNIDVSLIAIKDATNPRGHVDRVIKTLKENGMSDSELRNLIVLRDKI